MGKLVNETSICFHDYENENSNWKRDLKKNIYYLIVVAYKIQLAIMNRVFKQLTQIMRLFLF